MTNTNVRQQILVDLEYPIDVDGVTQNNLAIRRPTLADVVAVQKTSPSGPAEAELLMMAQLTGLSVEAVGMIDVQDYNRIRNMLNNASA